MHTHAFCASKLCLCQKNREKYLIGCYLHLSPVRLLVFLFFFFLIILESKIGWFSTVKKWIMTQNCMLREDENSLDFACLCILSILGLNSFTFWVMKVQSFK